MIIWIRYDRRSMGEFFDPGWECECIAVREHAKSLGFAVETGHCSQSFVHTFVSVTGDDVLGYLSMIGQDGKPHIEHEGIV